MALAKKKNGVLHPAREFPTSKLMPITALRKNPHNVRTHSKKQIRQIARSIEEFDFAVPRPAETLAIGGGSD